MKSSIVSYVGWLLLLGIFGLYAYGIITAIGISWAGDVPDNKYPEALSAAINSIQAVLLTNMGVLLGISVTNPVSRIARAMNLQRPNTGEAERIQIPVLPDPLELREKIQLGALVVYVVGLIVCTIGWGHDGFISDSKKIIDVVSTSGKMLIGVALSYLTAVLRR